ncbi:MAG: uroporphyrinogen decarboxylase [Sneathiella sp.]|nr:uroporphyrinogen decarboxylase [Sneathiella sp.]
MTNASNKRLLKSLSGEMTDRPPFWLMRQAGRYLPEYRETRAKAGNFLDLCYNPALAEEVTLQPLRRYGMDAAILFADILLIPHALGQPLAYREGEGPVLDPVRSIAGLKSLGLTKIHDTLSPVYETVARLSQSIPKDCTLIGFAGAPWTVATYMVEGKGSKDYAHIKHWAYNDPAGFGHLMDLLVEATTDYLLRQVAAGAEVIQIFDTWAGVLPDDEFRKWSIEPTKRIVEGLRTQHPDLPVIGFPKGVGANIIEFVRETGVTAVSLDTGTPLDWASKVLQPVLPVQGNLDPMLLVTGGAAMERRVADILRILGKKPFIFNLGHGIVPQTPPENVARLAQLICGE